MSIMIKEKLVDYLGKKYPSMREKFNEDQLKEFIDAYFDRTIYAIKDDVVLGVAIYLNINDEALKLLEEGKITTHTEDGMIQLNRMPGNHIHIFCLAVESTGLFLIGKRKLIRDKKPDSVSWCRSGRLFKIRKSYEN